MKQTLLGIIALMTFASFPVVGQKSKKSKVSMPVADSLFLNQSYKAAIPLYETLLKDQANQANVMAWNRLALAYYNLNDFTQALKYLDEVYKLNPRFQAVFLNKARAYSSMNDVASAIQMIDSAHQVSFFANFKILESDPAFENLRKNIRYKEVYDRLYASAYPCYSSPEAKQFDFWIGDWDVYLTSNLSIKTGVNRIKQQPGGCVIMENWEGAGPHRGVSMNYYDPSDSTWKQKWAGSGRDIAEFYAGKYEDGAMRFKSDIRNPDGTVSMGKLTFTKLAPEKVRQHMERSGDGGKTWQTVYDFTYIRMKNNP